MTDLETLRAYDAVVRDTVAFFYGATKETKDIVLNYFDPKDLDHLYLLVCANTARHLFGKRKILVDLPWYKFIFFKLKFKWCNIGRAKGAEGINCVKLLQDYYREHDTSLSSIYREYYQNI